MEITHAKSNSDAYFKLEEKHDTYNTWRCTHGGWPVDCNLDGTICKSLLKRYNYTHLGNFKLVKFFTKEEYMEEFGNNNPYEGRD